MVFGQHFFSESLKSQGIKEVRVVWADGAWKIAEEKFYAEKIKGLYQITIPYIV